MEHLENFLNLEGTIFDVRSPLEYDKGHIPGALSLPLFSNEERKVVGTLYKQVSPEEAYLKGLDFVGPKMSEMAKVALKHRHELVRIYCWRGGSRSQSVAWLFKLMGTKVETLKGGYKTFRRSVLALDKLLTRKQLSFITLGGWTGSGKSDLLREQRAFPIIDLEELAKHRGSAFGEIDGVNQPTQEHFENLVFNHLYEVPDHSTILVEDESRLIGKLQIPPPLYQRIISSPLKFLDIPKDERVQTLLKSYHPPSPLAIGKIEKRLGKEKTAAIQNHLSLGEHEKAAHLLIDYYDAAYTHSLKKRGSLEKETFLSKNSFLEKTT